MRYQRTARAGSVDVEAGTFPLVLATEGEATDGHILSIRGGEVPDVLPLQLSHVNDAFSNVGQLTDFQKAGRELRATGRIRLTGEGEALEFRKDLLDAIAERDVTGISVRWDALEAPTPRVDLPKSHAAHVSRDEKHGRKRFGLFFSRWRALEGSIVPVGADPAALIGRAEHARSEAAETFWRSAAEHVDEPDDAPQESAWRALEAACWGARDAGLEESDILNAVWKGCDARSNLADFREFTFGDRSLWLPADAYDALLARERAIADQIGTIKGRLDSLLERIDALEPHPPAVPPERSEPEDAEENRQAPETSGMTWSDAVELISSTVHEIADHREQALDEFRKVLDQRRGRVTR